MSERWKPEFHENYYYIRESLTVEVDCNEQTFTDKERIYCGNCFRTEEAAEAAAEKVKALLLSLHKEQPVADCNQLPKLTTEVFDRPDCPEWCKPGEWVYHSNGYYYTVKRVDVEDDDIRISDNAREYPYTANEIKTFFSPARLRPYNAEEIPNLPFEVSEINSDFRTIVASCKGVKIWLGGASTAISTEELMRDFTIDNKPAGVLEHLENGVWVK